MDSSEIERLLDEGAARYKADMARIATLEAELARVKGLAVWAAESNIWVGSDQLTHSAPRGDGSFAYDSTYFEHDGTPTGILAALERAKESSK